MAFKIITDSASDIPKYIIDEFNLHVIPTPVVINEKDYFDGETIFPKDFYSILEDKTKDIKTYHINSEMFKRNFEPYAKNGDEVLYMCFSTGIAGTFNAAHLAKEELLETYPDFKITIIDTKCASLGFGIPVYKLLLMQRNGADKETLIKAAKHFCKHMEHIVTVETLDYLYKGGRLSKLSYVVGGGLNIKPMIEINENGSLVAYAKVRGRKKAINKIIEEVGKRGKDLENQIIGVVHGDREEEAKELANALKEKYNVKEVVISYVGCAIGAHTGPGVIAAVCENESDGEFKEYLYK